MRPYLREINLSEARRRLSQLLREIEKDPDAGFQIKVRGKVVAELRSPLPQRGYGNAGEALLRAAYQAQRLSGKIAGKKNRAISDRYKEYLYGKGSPLLPRKRA
jgi:antitoxin (DNA-binding transcriptional repressor) of toxin-antitoxin stability system